VTVGGAQFRVQRQLLQVFQGSPQGLVQQWAVKETVELTVSGMEWNLTNLARFYGAGVTASTAAAETLGFGGDMNVLHTALVYRHSTPANHTIDLCIWDAQPSGDMQFQFQENAHEFPVTWSANTATQMFNGAKPPANEEMFRLIRRITIAGWPRP